MTQGGIGCLIFDSDGTLVDTLHLIVEAFNYAAEPVLGKRFDEADVSALLGPTMKRIFTNLLPQMLLTTP